MERLEELEKMVVVEVEKMEEVEKLVVEEEEAAPVAAVWCRRDRNRPRAGSVSPLDKRLGRTRPAASSCSSSQQRRRHRFQRIHSDGRGSQDRWKVGVPAGVGSRRKFERF